jgi:hypothetical protein
MFPKTAIRFFSLVLFVLSMLGGIRSVNAQSGRDSGVGPKLFNELSARDSLLFNAVFNTCNLEEVASLLTEDFRYYSYNGNPLYSSFQTHAEFMEGIRKNFCEKKNKGGPLMRRDVEQGTLQVYPLTDVEVLQTGTQHFYLLTPGQPEKLVEVSKFTRTWRRVNGDWKMAKEFDAFANTYSSHPRDSLYDLIAGMDSVLFAAYNNHNLEKIKTLFTNDLEFYHDKGGLTDYTQNMESFRNNFEKNNGIRRELVAGSLEVYPVNNFGAMEIGSHKFCHMENGKQDCGTFKFAMIWKRTNEGWKISRVISYGH